MKKNEYLHGFDLKEQKRLIHQAKFLEDFVYEDVDLSSNKDLLEIGCGVGAQTKILLKRFPQLNIHGVDLSQKQLSLASLLLKKEILSKKVFLEQQNAMNLKSKKLFDSVFICWFLEHVPDPLLVLKNAKKYLKKGAKIYCTEVFNQTLFLDPYSPNFIKYWFEFNDLQWSIKGHPFVGANLGNLLKASGFKNIEVKSKPFHFDSRQARKRKEFIDYFFHILLSAESALLETKRVTPETIRKMKQEVGRAKKTKDAVFYYSFVQATATA
jgi:ubiquinone/menaquinone biosynthesis C-methylase UbiE